MRPGPLALAGLAALAMAPVTASAEWGAPVRVSAADRASYGAPAVAAGPAGEALAAWVRRPAGAPRGAGRIQLAWREAGDRWGRPRTLSGPGATLPRVALNARGDAAAAWLEDRAIVAATRRAPGGGWRTARVGEVGAPLQDLVISLDRRGRPAAAWVERRDDDFQVRVATAAGAGAAWSVRPARLATPGPEPPALALSPGKGALAAWVDDGRVLAARTVAGAFERPVELSDPEAAEPGIALGGTGAALVSWSVRLPGGTPVLLATARPATAPSWGAAEDLGIGRAPVAAVNEVGDAVVAWGMGEPGREQAVEASARRRGGLWRASTVISPRDCGCVLTAEDAAVDGTGAAVVSWRREGGERGDAAGAALLVPGDRAWQPAPVPATDVAGTLVVAAATTAGAAAVWSGRGAGGGVRAVQHRP